MQEKRLLNVEPSALERKACCLHLGINVLKYITSIRNIYLKINILLSNAM